MCDFLFILPACEQNVAICRLAPFFLDPTYQNQELDFNHNPWEIEITSWKARAYGIFTRVGEVSEIERVSAANE